MRRQVSSVTKNLVADTEISAARMEIFPYEHSSLVTAMNLFFEKIASLSQLGGQKGIILPCMYFHLRSMQICFICKVASVDKAMIVMNEATICVAILVSSLEFHPSQSG